MELSIFLVKLWIVFVIEYIILSVCKTQDASALYALTINNKGFVNRFFSPKQLRDIEVCFKKLSIPYNTITVLLLLVIGIIVGSFVFVICQNIFPLTSMSVIMSAPLVMFPFWIIKYIAGREQNILEMGLNSFFIQLKTALKVSTDIIEAMRRIQNINLEPFSSYTKQLLTEINAGKLPEKALENFAQKINIKKFSLYINNVRYCHIYGGDITTLTEKTQQVISETIKQKKKRIKETKSICMVLYMLIVIDIYMYFCFIGNNQYYLDIMTNSFIGNVILNVNFISIWIIVWLSRVIRKLDY